MATKDYSDISKNLKQQLDILKLNQPIQLLNNTVPDIIGEDTKPNLIKIQDRLDNLKIEPEVESTSLDRLDNFILYSNFVLIILIPFGIYMCLMLLKPSYIYNIKTDRKTNKNVYVIDYNKLYFIISIFYIVILILLYLQKQKVVGLLSFIKNKIN
jgi:hypothetical protein